MIWAQRLGHVFNPSIVSLVVIGQEEEVNMFWAGMVFCQVNGNDGVPFLGFVNVNVDGDGWIVGFEYADLVER